MSHFLANLAFCKHIKQAKNHFYLGKPFSIGYQELKLKPIVYNLNTEWVNAFIFCNTTGFLCFDQEGVADDYHMCDDSSSLSLMKIRLWSLLKVTTHPTTFWFTQKRELKFLFLAKNKSFIFEKYVFFSPESTHKVGLCEIFQGFYNTLFSVQELFEFLFKLQLLQNHTRKSLVQSYIQLSWVLSVSIASVYASQQLSFKFITFALVVRPLLEYSLVKLPDNSQQFISLTTLLCWLQSFHQVGKNLNNYEVTPYLFGMANLIEVQLGIFAPLSFQSAQQLLMKFAVEAKVDWFHGLKENIISNKLFTSGVSNSNSIHFLNSLYKYKNYVKN